jgi:hypothetical protein
MVTLGVGASGLLGVFVGAFSDGDAVADGDLCGSDEDVFDQQSQDASTFVGGGGLGASAELGEEAFEVFGQGEVGLAVGELGVENFDLVAQVGFPSAQIGHAGAQLRMTTPSLRRSSRP